MDEVAAILTAISVALFVVETILYMAYVKWYYRLGPALISHRWQTSADQQAMLEAIDQARRTLKLGSRRRGDLFLFRYRWWESSIWSRVTVRISQAAHGAMITYQVRPFISPALLGLSMLLFFGGGRLQMFSLGYFLLVVLMYVVGLVWELRRLRSLEPLRGQLKALGLSVCSKCGYDRFGLPVDASCPECGAKA